MHMGALYICPLNYRKNRPFEADFQSDNVHYNSGQRSRKELTVERESKNLFAFGLH